MFERNRSNKQGTPKKEEARVAPEAPVMGSRPPVSSQAGTAAVIGPGIEIAGDVSAKADLVVNGKIQGSIVQGTHSVEIGESGQVHARVRAKLVIVSGEVRGDILGDEKVLISRTGRVLGNIAAPRVQLDDGALFKGSIDMTPPEVAKPASPASPTVGSAKPAATAGKKDDGPASKATGSSATTSPSGKDQGRKEHRLTLKSGCRADAEPDFSSTR